MIDRGNGHRGALSSCQAPFDLVGRYLSDRVPRTSRELRPSVPPRRRYVCRGDLVDAVDAEPQAHEGTRPHWKSSETRDHSCFGRTAPYAKYRPRMPITTGWCCPSGSSAGGGGGMSSSSERSFACPLPSGTGALQLFRFRPLQFPCHLPICEQRCASRRRHRGLSCAGGPLIQPLQLARVQSQISTTALVSQRCLLTSRGVCHSPGHSAMSRGRALLLAHCRAVSTSPRQTNRSPCRGVAHAGTPSVTVGGPIGNGIEFE